MVSQAADSKLLAGDQVSLASVGRADDKCHSDPLTSRIVARGGAELSCDQW